MKKYMIGLLILFSHVTTHSMGYLAPFSDMYFRDIATIFKEIAQVYDKAVIDRLLQEHKSFIDTNDVAGRSLMHHAAAHDNIALIKKLLALYEHDESHKTNVINRRDDKGNTPLHEAACKGYQAIVNYLLEEGADAYACNNDGNDMLTHLIKNDQSDLAFVMLGVLPIPRLVSLSQEASETTTSQGTEIDYAWCKTYKLLLEFEQALCNNESEESMHHRSEQIKTCNICVADQNGAGPLHWVARWGSSKLMETILSIPAVYELYKEKSWVNRQDKYGNTALHYAMKSCNYYRKALALIQKGADETIQNNRGESLEKLSYNTNPFTYAISLCRWLFDDGYSSVSYAIQTRNRLFGAIDANDWNTVGTMQRQVKCIASMRDVYGFNVLQRAIAVKRNDVVYTLYASSDSDVLQKTLNQEQKSVFNTIMHEYTHGSKAIWLKTASHSGGDVSPVSPVATDDQKDDSDGDKDQAYYENVAMSFLKYD